jgi:serine/threonine protein kinase
LRRYCGVALVDLGNCVRAPLIIHPFLTHPTKTRLQPPSNAASNPPQVRFEYASTYFLSGTFDVQTPGYRAPEALFRCGFSSNIDVWSIGVVLVELLMSEKMVPEGAEDMQAVRTRPQHAFTLTSSHTPPLPLRSSLFSHVSSAPSPTPPPPIKQSTPLRL